MITEEEALRQVLAAVTPAAPQELPLLQARGLCAARALFATVPLPGFDNSMMDGYALRAADSTRTEILPVTHEQPAGADLALVCPPGHAVRIFTGAPLPAGADAVIMQEDVDAQPGGIRCREPVTPGENIRRAGAELCAGQLMLSAGDTLTPARLGLLASQGLQSVPVHAPPRAAVLSTGDELRPPGQPLRPGEIYNSNGVMLQALLHQAGVPQVETVHCEDELEPTRALLAALLDRTEVILISGGVSVGARDQIKPALRALGIEPALWRVKVKPGKPFLFAHTQRSGRHVWLFGLPGNPVSSYITYQIFVRPALRRLLGFRETALPALPARSGTDLRNDGDRPHYLRGVLADGTFKAQGLQMSHSLFGLSQSEALLRLEPGQTVAAGENVTVLVTG